MSVEDVLRGAEVLCGEYDDYDLDAATRRLADRVADRVRNDPSQWLLQAEPSTELCSVMSQGADRSCLLRYVLFMRYPQGGGLTAERRVFREQLRMQAAEMFGGGLDNAVIAKELRVSVRSVQRWRSSWRDGGPRSLRSTGPASRPKLNEALFTVLEQELAKGPVAHGWPDQTWTLQRIRTLIGRRFHKSVTLSGVSRMLRRHGWTHQVPARRAVERDEAAVAGWVKGTWPAEERPRRRSGLGSSSRTRPGSR